MGERLQFFSAFLRNPATVGSLLPSSPALAREMVRTCDLRNARTVVELGAGTGPFTREILRHLGPDTLFIALELDEHSVAALRQEFPGTTIYHESAANLSACLARHGRQQADYILSGLPWGSLPTEVADSILQAVLTSLAPGGMFVTFSYVHSRMLPGIRRFRQRVQQHFSSVSTSPVVWNNVPPAVVVRCM
ncbi:MAG TPA: methyltransferase [Vicinamibacterales bacterium]|nr:methyltransferase [Vicinamibacterales bacterium]